MNKEQNKFIGMCLAKNNYFAACICNTEKTEKYICVQVIVYRKDTWEFYKSFSLQSLILTSDYSQWYEQAENFIALLDKPEDWKRPHRFCLARYAKKVVRDNFFYENLAYLKKVNNIDIYIWYYDKDSRFQEFLLIKNLNMLSDEEKKQLFILRDWEKEATLSLNMHNILYARKYLFKRIYNKNKFKDYYDKYNNELEKFIAENKDNIIGKS